MNSLLYLTPHDFNENMHHKIVNTSIVLFYATTCQHSLQLLPIFKKLPKTVNGGCQVGLFNVGFYQEIIPRSQNTDTPIKYVPYIVMYNNGVPFIQYEGEQNEKAIIEFIKTMIDKIKQETKRVKRAYCEGQPLCGDDEECYLVVDEKSANIS